MQQPEFFQRIRYVTLKLTNGCNLACSYCNVEAVTPKTPMMSIDLFKHVARLLIENSRSPQLSLEFHGGEPLLLADEWFEEAVHFARRLAHENGKFVEFPLVTNGTMMTEERLLKLHRLGIRLCISLDGPPEINDRIRGGGRKVERTIQMMHQHRIGFGLLTVLSRTNLPHMREFMDWLRDANIQSYRVNFLQPQGRGADESQLLTGDEMFDGVRQILDHMVETDVAVEEVETMMNVQRFLEGRDARPRLSCWEYQCQAGRVYVAVDLLGRIHACGTDLSNHVLGHVSQPIDDEHYLRSLERLHEKGDWVIRCFDCDARKICRHSCSTSDYNSETYKEHECRYTKLLYRHLGENPAKAQRIGRVMAARRGPQPGAFVPLSQLEVASAV